MLCRKIKANTSRVTRICNGREPMPSNGADLNDDISAKLRKRSLVRCQIQSKVHELLYGTLFKKKHLYTFVDTLETIDIEKEK